MTRDTDIKSIGSQANWVFSTSLLEVLRSKLVTVTTKQCLNTKKEKQHNESGKVLLERTIKVRNKLNISKASFQRKDSVLKLAQCLYS